MSEGQKAMSEGQKQNANGVAYQLEPLRGFDGLSTRVQEMPVPGPHQVVVRVRATSLNRRDIMLMEGTYPMPARPGVVPLVDGVGEVIARGSGVTRAALGDRVTGTYYVAWNDGPQTQALGQEQYGANHEGWLATYVLLDEDSVVHVPPHLTDEEAAALTCAGLVAWAALTKPLPVGPADTVLTVGSGPVGLFAIQHATMLGARVISITSSPEKAERLRKLGADEVVNRKQTPEWEQAVLDLTDGLGVQRVVDAVGHLTLPKSLAATAYNGDVVLIGAFPAERGQESADPLGGKYVGLRRIAVGSRADFESMNRTIAEHGLRPVIDRVYPFEQAVDAYRYFETGDPFGKVVITLP
ncbi:zinc-dependent alcohol dehydrogenase family protein [Nocardia sp. CDC160]|uniref:zinc-dependent alcohol dehydrogenase family protein n=1 Tax=Nocardia sp. CDC160 TaxID=3112166 RepID=UPI002DBF966F|nr:NAD(P)-dependent alcohol dehydrogenase [Nocardia sp. CDC160]MEC3920623.1 NAD(P)-dependent alcohol dehydrogenase [Nocardia sp. CDC160]